HDGDAGVVDHQVNRFVTYFGAKVRYPVGRSEIVDEQYDAGASWFHCFASLGQSDRVAAVQQQGHVRRGEFLRDCATDPATRPGDEITFHLSQQKTSNAERRTSNAELSEPPERKAVVGSFPQAQPHQLLPTAI